MVLIDIRMQTCAISETHPGTIVIIVSRARNTCMLPCKRSGVTPPAQSHKPFFPPKDRTEESVIQYTRMLIPAPHPTAAFSGREFVQN